MPNWNEEQAKFIQKLERMENTFGEIFEKDKDGIVIAYNDREKLKELQAKNASVLHKLKSGEFTVAIVGLEKAGKSTLGNALMELIVLPEYTERCTYTTTEIRSGSSDEAEVTFFNHAEFDDNLRKMLQNVGYKGPMSLTQTTWGDFERYWREVENLQENDTSMRDLYERHNGTTVEDLKDILTHKEVFNEVLGSEPRKFAGADVLKQVEFTKFVTSIVGYNGGLAVRKPYPYAVKNVLIHSTRLKAMSDAVFYDVPGFDSPTELHKEQTKNMLIKSDAIILVTDVGGRPNLTGTQLDMLRKSRDEDGIKLCDKVFVFGNRIDMAGNKQISKDNMAALINDAVNKYKIASEKRIVGGSAKGYLQSKGIESEDKRGDVDVNAKLKEWNMESGIEKLRDKLQDYYNNERFEVLKKRAEKTLIDTEDYLRGIVDKYPPEVLNRKQDGAKIALSLNQKLRKFYRESKKIADTHQIKITSEKPFSSSLSGQVDNIFLHTQDLDKFIEDAKLEVLNAAGGNFQASRVDNELRKKLNQEFIERLVEEVEKITQNRQNEIRDELVNTFLSILGMQPHSTYKKELENDANRLFDELLKEKGSKCDFNSLVQRFATFLIESLIQNPYGTSAKERLIQVKDNLAEFLALAVYYAFPAVDAGQIDFDNTEQRKNFFAMILAHENIGASSIGNSSSNTASATDNTDLIRNFFKKNEQALTNGKNLNIDALPFAKWGAMLANAGIDVNQRKTEIAKQMNDLVRTPEWKKAGQGESESLIEQSLIKLGHNKAVGNSEQSSANVGLLDQLEEFNKRGTEEIANIVFDENAMLMILDKDIDILRHIMQKSVIKAIGLERAFLNIITKNINVIRDNIDDDEGAQKYNNWIYKNYQKIMENEYAAIEIDNANNEIRKMIVKSIEDVLEKIDE